MNYEQGLATLKGIVQRRAPELLPDFSLLHFRLQDCLEREKKYGFSSDNNAERIRIVEELIHFTHNHFYLQFLDLCRSEEPTIVEKQPSNAILPSYELWTGNTEIGVQGDRYLLHEPIIIAWTPDQSALYQRAKAQQLGANRSVWLKQVQLYQATALSAAWKTTLEKESWLLDRLEQERRQDFPRRLAFEHNVHTATLVHTAVDGRSWTETFGASTEPLDPYLTRLLLRSAISLCGMLRILHSKQLFHRNLTPESILLLDGRRALLQDVGLATWKYVPGEGPDVYRAPEQGLSNRSLVLPGAYTDVYQLGMILYRFITGNLPASPRQLLPLHTRNEAISAEMDAVLQRALAFPVKERWRTIADFSSALRKTLS